MLRQGALAMVHLLRVRDATLNISFREQPSIEIKDASIDNAVFLCSALQM
jgi:hypothetical protein